VILGITVNGVGHRVEIDGPESLLRLLRDRLGLMGSKSACEQGECGSCTVILDGVPVCSCLIMAVAADGSEVVTVEGIAGSGGGLHPVQEAMRKEGAVQCGFCTPAMILSAKGLLDKTPHPNTDEIKQALSGVLCRCGTYKKVIEAVQAVAGRKDGL
jgi:carbon-monoxide dehydrogenase small subunit